MYKNDKNHSIPAIRLHEILIFHAFADAESVILKEMNLELL